MDARDPDLRRDQELVGREAELARLLRNLGEGRHTLLVGDFGIGKSRLMLEARLLLTGGIHRVDIPAPRPAVDRRSIITVSSPWPLGDCLREMAECLYRNGDLALESADGREDWASLRGRFSRLGNARMQSALLKGIAGSGKRYLLFAANLDRLTRAGLHFFQSLLAICVVCGSASSTKTQDAFRCFWSSFERLPLGALPPQAAAELLQRLMQRYPVDTVDPLMCSREILAAAGGNPFHIRNLLHRAATMKAAGTGDLRAFRAADEGPFFNMGPLYMMCAGVLTAVKFFSVGLDRREHYIFYSGVGFILYLTFRVFRNFFIFRPQRRT